MITRGLPHLLAITSPSWVQWVTAGTAVVGLWAIYFFYRQAREATRARSLQSALAVLDLIDDPDVRFVREWVFRPDVQRAIDKRFGRPRADTPKNEWPKAVTPAQLDAFFSGIEQALTWAKVHQYLASIEHISMLIIHDFAPDEIVDLYFGRLLPYQWFVFSPLILSHRLYYKNEDFLQHLEIAARLLGDGNCRKIMPRRWNLIKRNRFWSDRRNLVKELRGRHVGTTVALRYATPMPRVSKDRT